MFQITWLGQAGLFVENGTATVMIDPYLSDSVGRRNPERTRQVPVEEKWLEIQPDFMLFSHNHIDHYDPETAPRYLGREPAMTVLCPHSVWTEARECGGSHNYVEFDRGTVWTEKGIRFTAIPARHSDPFAIGFVLEDLADGDKVYVTGDTLYHKDIFRELPEGLRAVLLPVNGAGNNMNGTDAVAFAKATGARYAVPLHTGMLDTLDPAELFRCENRILPKIWEVIPIPVQ